MAEKGEIAEQLEYMKQDIEELPLYALRDLRDIILNEIELREADERRE